MTEALNCLTAEGYHDPLHLKLATFLAVTMRVGEKFHVDIGDAQQVYTMVIPFGDWVSGGVLEIPNLDLSVPLPS